jgi:hypothetical protein
VGAGSRRRPRVDRPATASERQSSVMTTNSSCQADHDASRTAPIGRGPCPAGVTVGVGSASSHMNWSGTKREIHSNSVNNRPQSHWSDALVSRLLCTAVVRLPVIRRRSIPGARVWLVRLWGLPRPQRVATAPRKGCLAVKSVVYSGRYLKEMFVPRSCEDRHPDDGTETYYQRWSILSHEINPTAPESITDGYRTSRCSPDWRVYE